MKEKTRQRKNEVLKCSLNNVLVSEVCLMNIKDIIKGLKSQKITQVDIANRLGIKKQNLSNKLTRGTFSIEDLNKIGEMLGMSLAFVPYDMINEDMIIIDPMIRENESQE